MWKTANSLGGEPACQREALVSTPCWISPHAWPGVLGAQNQTGHSSPRCLCLQASGFTWAGDHLGAPVPLFSAFDILLTAPALGSGGLSLPPWMPTGPLSGSLEFLTPTASWRTEAQSHWHPQCPSWGPIGRSVAVRGIGGWPPSPGWRERPGHPLPLCCHQAPCMNATFVFVLLLRPLPGDSVGWELWLGNGEPGSAPATHCSPGQVTDPCRVVGGGCAP